MTKEPGRLVICSCCSAPTAAGTTQVYRRIVFHFCLDCWNRRRLDCMDWMRRVAAPAVVPVLEGAR